MGKQEVVNVLDWTGATKNGYPDDVLVAFDSALSAAAYDPGPPNIYHNPTRKLVIPARRFYLAGPWVINRPACIEGDGAGIARFQNTQLFFNNTGGVIFDQASAHARMSGVSAVNLGVQDDALAIVMANPVPRGDHLAGAYMVAFPQWRPSTAVPVVKVGAVMVPTRFPGRKALLATNTAWYYGYGWRCTKANGSSAPTATGAPGLVEPAGFGLTTNPRAGGGMPGGAGANYQEFTVNTGTDFATTAANHGWSNGQSVRLQTTGVLPAVASGGALAALTNYWVGNVTAATFKLYRDSALTTLVDFTGTGTGVHTVYTYTVIDMSPVVDNELEWTPFIAHGFDVKPQVMLDHCTAIGFPGNGLNVNSSTLYALDPGIDGQSDYGNASLSIFRKFQAFSNGGNGQFFNGYDSSVHDNSVANLVGNHGYGLWDSAGFGSVHSFHADGNEQGEFWVSGGAIKWGYCEGDRCRGTVKSGAKFEAGIVYGFSGCPVTWGDPLGLPMDPRTWAPRMSMTAGNITYPTVDDGFHYRCMSTTGGGLTAGVTFTVNTGTDVCTTGSAHGFTSGNKVRLNTTSILPAPSALLTDYYVGGGADFTATTFKMYTDAGLTTLVDFSSTGTGTHSVGKEPTWPGFMIFYRMDDRNAQLSGTDTYANVTDGEVTMRAWMTSELSNGSINPTGINVSLDRYFFGRVHGQKFWTASEGDGAAGAFSWSGPATEDSGAVWGMKYQSDYEEWMLKRSSALTQAPLSLTGSSHSFGPGHVNFRRGLHIANDAGGISGKIIFVDVVPADGTHIEGTLAIHRDATSGQPFMWHREAAGTWTVIMNKP